MNERKKRSDILRGSTRETLAKQWKDTEAAKDLAPLPPGEYLFRILSGELFTSNQGTPGYKLTLEVTEGEHDGRRCWHDVWLTQAALPMAKRDLGKIGVSDLEQLERPLPPGILVRAKIALRKTTMEQNTTALSVSSRLALSRGMLSSRRRNLIIRCHQIPRITAPANRSPLARMRLAMALLLVPMIGANADDSPIALRLSDHRQHGGATTTMIRASSR
jgi:hypothetical protein